MALKEYVILVDETDTEVGREEKLKAHELGLLHRAFSVFLFRKVKNEIQLLIQQRAKHKYHCGGLWANTCCSHQQEGESSIDAGKRRLIEEMGVDVEALFEVGLVTYKAVFDNGLTEHEIDHILIGRFDGEEIAYNKDEVEAAEWVALPVLERAFSLQQNTFTPWFPLAYNSIPKRAIDRLFT